MPKFIFTTVAGTAVVDEFYCELTDFREARIEAIRLLADIVIEEPSETSANAPLQVRVDDQSGAALLVLDFQPLGGDDNWAQHRSD